MFRSSCARSGLLLCLIQAALGHAASTLSSGLSILTHNDLYGAQSYRTQSVLVTSPISTAADALAVCSALGEKLWTPQTDDFLPYLAYQGTNGSFWAANGSCVSIGANGQPSTEQSCDGDLPALCSNSAPLANSTYQDNSTYWQTTLNAPDQTSFTGYRTKSAFNFLGIPYANPFARWEYSTLRQYNQTQVSALAYGSQCVQAGGVGSEDCLFANIWTPYLPGNATTADNSALKAVMFQIHGGAYTGGTGADPGLAGQSLASRGDVVVVTINYRLTTLGFLALDDGATNGNYGIGDMITALQWVQKYISTFGGDPSRVTIFGQSAGAGAVRALLGSPLAQGLFSGAIMESNLDGLAYAQTYSEYIPIAQEVEAAAVPILNATNCTTASSALDCLRAVDAHTLASLSTVARFVVQDGTIITQPTLPVTGNGTAAHVPVMLGFMRDDGASFISFPHAGQDNVTSLLGPAGFSGVLTPDIAALYPVPDSTPSNRSLEVYNASAAVATDTEFRCLDLASANSAVLHGVWPAAYVFTFNRTYNGYDPNPPVCEAPETPGHPYGDPEEEYFKCHSGELAYVFGTIAYTGQPDRDGRDIPMSQYVGDCWTAFARTANPNPDPAFLQARGFTNTSAVVAQVGEWPGYEARAVDNGTLPELRVFQWPPFDSSVYVFSSEERCDAWGFGLDFYERHPLGNNVTL